MSYLRPYLGNTKMADNVQFRLQTVLDNKAVFRYATESQYCFQAEKLLQNILHTQHAILITNGTVALKAALLGLRPKIGQWVFIPSISFIATANAVLSCGLIPVLIDVDDNGMMCPKALKRTLNHLEAKPLAVIAVHLEGTPASIADIAQICQQHHVHLIEDCAQAMGVKHQQQPVGTFGEYGCFSFQANKFISSGEGGLLIAQNHPLFINACMMTDHGAERTAEGYPDWSNSIGFGDNNKFNEIQATLLIDQLENIEQFRALLIARYQAILQHLPTDWVTPRPEGAIPVSVWLKRSKLPKDRLNSTLLYDWKAWDLANHPIIKNQLSPYSDRFPWSLHQDPFPVPALAKHPAIVADRICLPVPIDNATYENVLQWVMEGKRA
ncbi:DegT/DnrJ/EryC1/StrS family aminotransferase [Xenorhabdus sp. IM139775]|uniref:DegT/DnrJ/EryC1/StrS family aminotransferase n=1 Tax=Xenorhabdus sp. IM139775 TaxID=3025876 RepID=UPI0023582201|nr:DegT/DnrJ/EryC1/StrS family aminotransferase [Xenorhabdus sp. IM139775]MDC9593447.1 DegT/DnrJ/EryC1/StrS family aminotransferase [Xenorhabdus sp. IM139775]